MPWEFSCWLKISCWCINLFTIWWFISVSEYFLHVQFFVEEGGDSNPFWELGASLHGPLKNYEFFVVVGLCMQNWRPGSLNPQPTPFFPPSPTQKTLISWKKSKKEGKGKTRDLLPTAYSLIPIIVKIIKGTSHTTHWPSVHAHTSSRLPLWVASLPSLHCVFPSALLYRCLISITISAF